LEILKSPDSVRSWVQKQRGGGRTIALVPTMGFFHQGHLRLMRMAAQHADVVVVSLFVNPIQFGPGEDLDRYPRNLEQDCEMAAAEGVKLLFCPESVEMYPDGFQTTVSVGTLSGLLCGRNRPGHFDGVTTVVSKLFHIVEPDLAVFGQKDFQQLAIIRRMVSDLDMGVRILAHPIVRDSDGLAMSSRNIYLEAEQRKSALSLSKGLALARLLVAEGERVVVPLLERVRRLILAHFGTTIDYIACVNAENLEPVEAIDAETLLVLAVTIEGRVRLIDNGLLLGP